jgi:hypothetical protein
LGALKEFQQAFGCNSVASFALYRGDDFQLMGDFPLALLNALWAFIQKLPQI